MSIEIIAYVLLGCLLVCIGFMVAQERRHRRKTIDLKVKLGLAEDQVGRLASLVHDVQASLRRRERISAGLTAPLPEPDPLPPLEERLRQVEEQIQTRVSEVGTESPEPWQNGLYRLTQDLTLSDRRLEQDTLLFTSEHHVLDSVSVQQARGTGSTAGRVIDRSEQVDRDLRQALRLGWIERMADAEVVERLGGSLQQVFQGFGRSMERMSESMGPSLDRMFRDFNRSLAGLNQSDRTDSMNAMLRGIYGTPNRGPGNPEAIVAALRKVNAKKAEPKPEPKRPSRYDVLVDDDEVV